MNEHYDMVIHLLMEGGADPDAKQSSQVRHDSDLQCPLEREVGVYRYAIRLSANQRFHQAFCRICKSGLRSFPLLVSPTIFWLCSLPQVRLEACNLFEKREVMVKGWFGV